MTAVPPYKFSLISPQKILFAGELEMAVLPGSEGDFGVLARHTPFMTTLRAGTITLHQLDGKKTQFTVSTGFADITPEEGIALVEENNA
jgi:F-type H+-transporting ATPase subunit epsilon